MSKTNGALIAGFCLGLGGCYGANDPVGGSLEQSVAAPQSQSQLVALAPASAGSISAQPIAALPPEVGAISNVHAHDYVNGFRQDILLKGSPLKSVGTSMTVLAQTSHQSTLDEAVPLYKPTEAAIRSELGAQFPKIAMQVVDRPSSNAYGPYGLALGRAGGGVHCLYMWQWIDENRLPRDSGVTGPVSVRVRLCQSNTNFDAMAKLVDQLKVGRGVAGDNVAANNDAAVVTAPGGTAKRKSAPRKHVKRVAARRPAEDRSESALVGSAATPIAPAMPSASAPLATDLPPQAFQGPKASSAKPN